LTHANDMRMTVYMTKGEASASEANQKLAGFGAAHLQQVGAPPTICVLGLRGFPDVMGGVESHCEHIYRRMHDTSQYNFVVLGRSGYMKESRQLGERLEVVPLFSVRNKYLEALPNALMALLHARFKRGAKMVHIHAIGPGLVAPLAKLLGMRVVVTHHGQDYRRAKWKWPARFALRMGEMLSLSFADRVIVVSRSLTETLKQRFPRRAAHIRHVPNGAAAPGAAPAEDKASALTRFGLEPGGYVLSVGRLVAEKNMHDLIAAFRTAKTGLKLVIAGGADHDDAYVRTLRAQAGDDIIFTGQISHQTLQPLYANAALFVLASSHEGMPIAALEALAAGAPVLLSDIPAHRDLNLAPQHYFPVGVPAALAARLSSASDDVKGVPDFALAPFDWGHIARETQAIYAEALAGAR
jgi:glycosyltransferase involved in cell wall biosynthesis